MLENQPTLMRPWKWHCLMGGYNMNVGDLPSLDVDFFMVNKHLASIGFCDSHCKRERPIPLVYLSLFWFWDAIKGMIYSMYSQHHLLAPEKWFIQQRWLDFWWKRSANVVACPCNDQRDTIVLDDSPRTISLNDDIRFIFMRPLRILFALPSMHSWWIHYWSRSQCNLESHSHGVLLCVRSRARNMQGLWHPPLIPYKSVQYCFAMPSPEDLGRNDIHVFECWLRSYKISTHSSNI